MKPFVFLLQSHIYVYIISLALFLNTFTITTTAESTSTYSCCVQDESVQVTLSPWSVRVGDRAYYCGPERGDLKLEWSSKNVDCSCEKPTTSSSCNETSEWFRDVPLALKRGRFVCDNAKKTRLELTRMNDDFCDCGSDEPETSACSLGKFVCKHRSTFTQELIVLPSSRVNDGVPDCCDCSDENNPAVVALCDPNGCKAKENELKLKAESRKLVWEQGMHRRAEILESIEANMKSMSEELRVLEAKDADDAPFLLVQEAHQRASSLKDSISKTEASIHTSNMYKLVQNEKDSILVSWALKILGTSALRKELELTTPECEASKEEGKDTCEADVNPEDVVASPKFSRELIWRLANSKGPLELAKVIGTITDKDLLENFERVHAEAERTKMSLDTRAAARTRDSERIKEIITKLTENVHAQDLPSFMHHWNDVVYKKTIGEYEYSLNMFRDTKQGSTLLGVYTPPMILTDVSIPPELREDDDVPTPTLIAHFQNGLKCFTGVTRSATVYARCGPEDEIMKIVEPETCKYDVLIQSPAACFGASDQVRPRTFWESFVARIKRIF